MRSAATISRNTEWIVGFFSFNVVCRFFFILLIKISKIYWIIQNVRDDFFTSFYVYHHNKCCRRNARNINDWFGRSQNGIAESQRYILNNLCYYYGRIGGESRLKNFNHALNGRHKWTEEKSFICFIKKCYNSRWNVDYLQSVRGIWFNLINKYNDLLYTTISNIRWSFRYEWQVLNRLGSIGHILSAWFIARKQASNIVYIENYYGQFHKIHSFYDVLCTWMN